MKLGFILFMLTLSFLTGCSLFKKEDKPQPPVVVPPVVLPPVDQPKPTWPSGWDASQEFCKPAGKKFNCGNPVWYGLLGCAPDSDGDNHAEGTAYFASLDEIKAMSEKQNVTVRVKMKDGSTVQYGVGFAAPCSEM